MITYLLFHSSLSKIFKYTTSKINQVGWVHQLPISLDNIAASSLKEPTLPILYNKLPIQLYIKYSSISYSLFQYYIITSSLLSLPQELFNYIVNYLSRKYISILLATSKSTYIKGTCAFNKSCFYIILAKLLYKGLYNTKKILDNIHARYIRTIYFKAYKR